VLSLDEALDRVLARVPALPAERVPLEAAFGRILAEDVDSAIDIPGWDNSAMDGFAVRAADTADPPVTLRVLETVPAGGVPTVEVTPGTCSRIMTGAPMPRGADAAVMIEHTDAWGHPQSAAMTRVTFQRPATAGQHVRPRGDDVSRGQRVLSRGAALTPAAVGMLSALGRPGALVVQRPVVAVLSTGDEVVEAGYPLGPGQIYSSNTHSLLGLVREAGGVGVDCGIAPDDPAGLAASLTRCLRADVILTTGGVSVGDFDFVKGAFEGLGAELDFWKVAIKPGKPLAFGQIGGIPAFGLPGNPVSCVVNFLQFVRPFLRKMQGLERLFLPVVSARLSGRLRKRPGRAHFARVRLSWGPDGLVATSTGSQSSGVLTSLVLADGLAILPRERGDIEDGERVRVQIARGEWLDSASRGFWAAVRAPAAPAEVGGGGDCC